MITEVAIKNLALAENIEFTLKSGLNVFTGETGAGKSLVISAIAFAFGFRSGIVKMRDGSETAQITVTADISKSTEISGILEESGVDSGEDGEIIITRNINADGKTKNFINGCKVAVSVLQKLGQQIVEISGQNEELLIADTKIQLELFDRYCGEEIITLKNKCSELYHELKNLINSKNELIKSESERAREIDLYSYQVNEIAEAGLYENEETELSERVEFLKNAEQIAKIREEVLGLLDGGDDSSGISVLGGISKASSLIGKLAEYDRNFEQMAQAANDAYYALRDISDSVSGLEDQLDYSENELNEKMDRLHKISQLKRKYGATISDILKYYEASKQKLDKLKNFEENFAEINGKIEKRYEEYCEIADKINIIRQNNKGKIESAISGELHTLDMKNAAFVVSMETPAEKDISKITVSGFDRIEFKFVANPGMPPAPISETASGGEMSRIMLAIKNVLSAYSNVPSIIFDEIDTGIGGFTLNAIGEKLRTIALKKQVICITHSPIIASFASGHFMVKKEVINNEKTLINIRQLANNEIEGEIARMLGNDSEIGVSHARELLSKNKE